jgi:hypothetical protein
MCASQVSAAELRQNSQVVDLVIWRTDSIKDPHELVSRVANSFNSFANDIGIFVIDD